MQSTHNKNNNIVIMDGSSGATPRSNTSVIVGQNATGTTTGDHKSDATSTSPGIKYTTMILAMIVKVLALYLQDLPSYPKCWEDMMDSTDEMTKI